MVVGIIVVLAALVTPSSLGLLRSSRLEQSSLAVLADLDLARQTATARNRCMEVRFIRFPSEGPDAGFRATQLFLIEENGEALPQKGLRRFSQGVVADPRPAVSSIFDASKRTLRAPTEPHPTAHELIEYFAIRYNPDGSTDLQPVLSTGSALWFVTLQGDWAPGKWTGSNLPPNFSTIQIDPASGQVTTHRP